MLEIKLEWEKLMNLNILLLSDFKELKKWVLYEINNQTVWPHKKQWRLVRNFKTVKMDSILFNTYYILIGLHKCTQKEHIIQKA